MTATVATVIAAVVISAIICFPVIATLCMNRWNTRQLSAESALKGVAKAKEREARKRVAREWAMIMRMIRSTIRSGGTSINFHDLYPENEDRLRKLGYVVHNGLVSWDNVENEG